MRFATRLFSALTATALLLTPVSSVLADTSDQIKGEVKRSPLEQASRGYGVSIEFLTEELDKGYTLSDVIQALRLQQEIGEPYEVAIKKVKPEIINPSLDATSEVTWDQNLTQDIMRVIDQAFSHVAQDDLGADKDQLSEKSVSRELAMDQTTDGGVKTGFTDHSASSNQAFTMAATPKIPPIVGDFSSRRDEAPFSIPTSFGQISTFSGEVTVKEVDLTLPGRNGLGFDLRRLYQSNLSQLWKMSWESRYNKAMEEEVIYNLNDPKTDPYSIGAGWRLDIPFIETETVKSGDFDVKRHTLHWLGGAAYTVDKVSSKIGGTPFLNLSFGSRYINNELEEFVKDNSSNLTYYFSKSGALSRIVDEHNNQITFTPTSGMLKIEDSAGNNITIRFTADQVVATMGSKQVVYKQQVVAGTSDRKLLSEVMDPSGQRTIYDYLIKDAKYQKHSQALSTTSNPYALLSGVTYKTGAKALYTYSDTPEQEVTSTWTDDETGRVRPATWYEKYRVSGVKDRITLSDGKYEDKNQLSVTKSTKYGTDSVPSNHVAFMTSKSVGTKTVTTNNLYNVTTKQKVSELTTDGVQTTETSYRYSDSNSMYPTSTTSNTYSNTTSSPSFSTSTSQTYDSYGNVLTQTDANKVTTSYEYDPIFHSVIKVTVPLDASRKQVTEFVRNSFGDVTQKTVKDQSGALLSQETYTIDAYGNVIGQDVLDGSRTLHTDYAYDSDYQAYVTKFSSKVTRLDGTKQAVTTGVAYNPNGTVKSSVDGNSNTTTYTYDVLDRVVEVRHPDLTTSTFVYKDTDNVVEYANESGLVTYTKWNPLGWKLETGIKKDGAYQAKAKYGYDANGRQIWSEDALGNRTLFEYDSWGRVIITTYPDGVQERVVYDDVTNSVTVTNADGVSVREKKDLLGRVTLREQLKSSSAQTLETRTYDNVGNILSSKDANGNVTQYQFNVLNRLTGVTDAEGKQVQYVYNGLGKINSIVYPDGNKVQKQFDELGRLSKQTDALGQVDQYDYDNNGNVIKHIDRKGGLITSQYDSRNRLIRVAAGTGNQQVVNTFDYEGSGRRVAMTDETGTTRYSYDSIGQLASMTYPDGKSINYTYDGNGNVTSLKEPFGKTYTYALDNRNRVNTVYSNGTTSPADIQYQFTKGGAIQTANLQNGISTSYEYNEFNFIKSETQKKSDNTPLALYGYTYDVVNNQTSKKENNTTYNFKYDALNRISTSSQFNEAYTYDSRGNRSTMQSENLILPSDATYEYDDWNQLKKVTTGDNKVVTYKYNGDGIMTERTENGVTTRYYYSGSNIIAEATVTNGVPSLLARYVRGTVGNLVAREDAIGNKAYYLHNGHGDVTELRDSKGDLLNSYTYDIWGNPITVQEKVSNPFRYSGEFWDATTKLQDLRARWYDPGQGRFLNEDTYEGEANKPLSLNLYTYVLNNPLAFTDPTGHKEWLIHGTWSSPDTWTSDFVDYVEKLFNETSEKLEWSGNNDTDARLEAADKLADEIYNWHIENKNEPIRLIGHSHGGNIAILIANNLSKKGMQVDTLITIATPQREYQLKTKVGQYINVFNDYDDVQTHGGPWGGVCGPYIS